MIDPFFYLEWLTEEDFSSPLLDLNLVNEIKDFTKILVIPLYPVFYENHLDLDKVFENIFKKPRQFEQRTYYDLIIKNKVVECEYNELLFHMKSKKTNFFTEDEFLLMRNLVIKDCRNKDYDKVITISNKEINFEHLKFFTYKELNREKIYGIEQD